MLPNYLWLVIKGLNIQWLGRGDSGAELLVQGRTAREKQSAMRQVRLQEKELTTRQEEEWKDGVDEVVHEKDLPRESFKSTGS